MPPRRDLRYRRQMTAIDEPSWSALEDRLVTELRAAAPALVTASAEAPLAAVVLWSDPFKGWYEVLADTAARNRSAAREWNRALRTRLSTLAGDPEAWRTAKTDARWLQVRDVDPRYGDYAFADEPLHRFDVSFDTFLRSPRYAELDVGGEDGWLEGHVRYVIARALLRIVDDGAFAAIRTDGPLRLGYAYPDRSEAIFVAHLEPGEVLVSGET